MSASETVLRAKASLQTLSAYNTLLSIDPLLGTRPARILLGYWKSSSEEDPKDRHAVYGILWESDVFRLKLVRETRDGRNFPGGSGNFWIPYKEVEFEEYLKNRS